jgi:Na+/H+ antiporter NhaD/arsenite permease-like protein
MQDPIILSGTAFLAYLTRVASNIRSPRAWIFSQFAVANISSAILVSSNPTNLVLAGAFKLEFVTYTANMVVPVVVTAIILFPFLLYIIFPSVELIPTHIEMEVYSLSDRSENRLEGSPPDLPTSSRNIRRSDPNRPYLRVRGAIFGGILFAITLTVLLATNAADKDPGVFAITVPAAFVMLCRDIYDDWYHRKDHDREEQTVSHAINFTNGLMGLTAAQANYGKTTFAGAAQNGEPYHQSHTAVSTGDRFDQDNNMSSVGPGRRTAPLSTSGLSNTSGDMLDPRNLAELPENSTHSKPESSDSASLGKPAASTSPRDGETDSVAITHVTTDRATPTQTACSHATTEATTTIYSILRSVGLFFESKLPTVSAVVTHLPFALIPFAFSMFILVEGLVSQGWVELFASAWGTWINKTNVVGALGAIGFLSVCLCNVSIYRIRSDNINTCGLQFAGTNIGTTILLSRILQQWLVHHTPSERTKDATVSWFMILLA